MKRKQALAAVVATLVAAVGVTAAFQAGIIPGTEPALTKWARGEVRGLLRDPYSAVFSDERAGQDVVCGNVNARNAYGAFSGNAAFVADRTAETLLDPGDLDPDHIFRSAAAVASREPGAFGRATEALEEVFEWCRFHRAAATRCPKSDADLARIERTCAAYVDMLSAR